QRHDGAVHLDLVEALPARAGIAAAVEAAVMARGGDAERSKKRLPVMRRGLDVAGVGGGREAADAHILPAPSAVERAEQPHAEREDDALGRGRADGKGVTIEHTLAKRVADDLALEMRRLGEADEVARAILPRLAAIAARHHAADLERGIKLL